MPMSTTDPSATYLWKFLWDNVSAQSRRRRWLSICAVTAAMAPSTACEDYRAAADIDLEMDEADDKAGHKISAPVLALWGAKGVVGHLWEVLATWRAKATSVSGRALDCGHLLPEEQPAEVLAELQQFFRG